MSLIPAPLQPYVIYAKLAGAAAILAVVGAGCWHFGGLSKQDELDKFKTAQQAQYAANLKTVADTLNKQIQDGIADRAKLQKVIDAYDLEKTLPPITAGVVERLRYIQGASCAANNPVPGAGAVAGGAQAAGGVPASLSELERLHQAAFDAAARDSQRLNAMRQLAP